MPTEELYGNYHFIAGDTKTGSDEFKFAPRSGNAVPIEEISLNYEKIEFDAPAPGADSFSFYETNEAAPDPGDGLFS